MSRLNIFAILFPQHFKISPAVETLEPEPPHHNADSDHPSSNFGNLYSIVSENIDELDSPLLPGQSHTPITIAFSVCPELPPADACHGAKSFDLNDFHSMAVELPDHPLP